MSGAISGLVRKTNTLSNALLNISAHYDISNEMFAAFLSPDMTYSCPIWKPKSSYGEKEPQESVEEAQLRRLDRGGDNAKLRKTSHPPAIQVSGTPPIALYTSFVVAKPSP